MLLKRSRPWDRQPQGTVKPAYDSQLTRDVRVLATPGAGQRDLVAGAALSPLNVSAGVGAAGRSWQFGGALARLEVPYSSRLSVPAAWTVFALVRSTSNTGGTPQVICSQAYGGADIPIMVCIGGSPGNAYDGAAQFAGTVWTKSGIGGIDIRGDGLVHAVVATAVSGVGSWYYVDGVLAGSSASWASHPSSSQPLHIGGYANDSVSLQGDLYLFGMIGRAWSAAEVVRWSRSVKDRWSVFAPRRLPIPVAASSGADFTHTATGGLTLSGAATTSYTASFATTAAGGLTFSGAATTAYTAAYSATGAGGLTFGGAATASFETGYSYTGTGGIQFGGAATVSSTADFSATGSGGVTFGGSADAVADSGFSFTGSGGLQFGGAAATTATADHVAIGSGGLNLGGAAAVEFTANVPQAEPTLGGRPAHTPAPRDPFLDPDRVREHWAEIEAAQAERVLRTHLAEVPASPAPRPETEARAERVEALPGPAPRPAATATGPALPPIPMPILATTGEAAAAELPPRIPDAAEVLLASAARRRAEEEALLLLIVDVI